MFKNITNMPKSIIEMSKHSVETGDCPLWIIHAFFKDSSSKGKSLKMDIRRAKRPMSVPLQAQCHVRYEVELRVERESRRTYTFPLQRDNVSESCEVLGLSRQQKRSGTNVGLKRKLTPIKWFRVDPDAIWFAAIILRVEEIQWLIDQMAHKPGVQSTLEVVHALSFIEDTAASGFLENILIAQRQKQFYPVRLAAARALADAAQRYPEKLKSHNVAMLLSAFKLLYFDRTAEVGALLPNDFNNFSEFFLKKGLPEIMGRIRLSAGISDVSCVKFLLMLLKENDNSANPFSDGSYLASVIRGVGYLKTERRDFELRREIFQQLHRYMHYDEVFPSPRREVSCACLEASSNLERNLQHLDEDDQNMHDFYGEDFDGNDVAQPALTRNEHLEPIQYQHYLRPPAPDSIRVSAFAALANLSIEAPEYFNLLAEILEKEPVKGVRLEMARRWDKIYDSVRYQADYARDNKSTDPAGGTGVEINLMMLGGEESMATSTAKADAFEQPFGKPRLPLLRILSFDALQEDTEEMRQVVDRFWKLLIHEHDFRVRAHLYHVYDTVFAEAAPPCATTYQRALYDEAVSKQHEGQPKRRGELKRIRRAHPKHKQPVEAKWHLGKRDRGPARPPQRYLAVTTRSASGRSPGSGRGPGATPRPVIVSHTTRGPSGYGPRTQ